MTNKARAIFEALSALLLLLSLSEIAHAELFRCTQGGKVAYQETPCNTVGQQQTVIENSSKQREQNKPSSDAVAKKRAQLTKEELYGPCEKFQKDSSEHQECLRRGGCRYELPFANSTEIDACATRKAKELAAKDAELNRSLKQINERIVFLTDCLKKSETCDLRDYQTRLQCLPIGYVEQLFGSSGKTQSIGGQKFVYYDAPIHNGKRFTTSRLQLVIGYCNDIPMPGGVSNRVKEVNVY